MIYWFIGQPHAGKTTLAKSFCEILISESSILPVRFDGDDLRKIFATDGYSPTTFTKEWRVEQTRSLQRLVAHIADQGITVIVSTVNPYRDVREEFKNSRSDVKEIYVHTTEIRGREKFHVKDYEPPLLNFIDIDTTGKSVESVTGWMYAKIL